MREKLTEAQKDLVMLYGDLLGSVLSSKERIGLRCAMKEAGSDAEIAAGLLPADMRSKVQTQLAMGLKFSVELGKLGQRGISVLFPEEKETGCLNERFFCDSPVLFAAGSEPLLDDGKSPVFMSLSAFKAAGCKGILIADRAFDALLRDSEVREAIVSQRALLVSDLTKSRATIKPLTCVTKSPDTVKTSRQLKKRVFISGSRSQRLIPEAAQESLKAIIGQEIEVLIGDSSKGVDNEVIDFLRAPLYEHVAIYTISNSPRIQPEPEWRIEMIEPETGLKPQQRQMAKDRAMANDANWGLALFNPIEINRYGALQVSAGTLRNTIQMLLQGKLVKFFYMYEGEMHYRNLKKLEDLETLIASYRSEQLSSSEAELILSAKGVTSDASPREIKADKIMMKYRSLLKDERRLSGAHNVGSAYERHSRNGKSKQFNEPAQPSLFDIS